MLVTADPAGLSRVVSNLLMNAIRHTPADGVVEITARAVANGVELSVTDGCGGMREEDIPRVFDVGWQGSNARTPDHLDATGGAGRPRSGHRQGNRGGPSRASGRHQQRTGMPVPGDAPWVIVRPASS